MFKIQMRRCGVLFFLLLLIAALCMPAFAAAGIDTERNVTLTITYRDEGAPISGAAFDLYRVADVSSDAEFALSGDFAGYPVDINSGAWGALTETLGGYVARDQLQPADSGQTDADGSLTFPTRGTLQPGLYLVLGRELATDGHLYKAQPFLVCLPGLEETGGDWTYDVTALPKFEDSTVPGGTVDLRVLKVWKDDGHQKDRPHEVTVQLLRDGAVFDTVTLNAENNWRCAWQGLDAQYDWTVVEQGLDGYTVAVTRDGTAFVVTNTYDEPDTPGSPPPNVPKLPQTGALWWPVPLLALVGMLLFAIGFVRRKGKRHE